MLNDIVLNKFPNFVHIYNIFKNFNQHIITHYQWNFRICTLEQFGLIMCQNNCQYSDICGMIFQQVILKKDIISDPLEVNILWINLKKKRT